jgi:hypothetical protein
MGVITNWSTERGKAQAIAFKNVVSPRIEQSLYYCPYS